MPTRQVVKKTETKVESPKQLLERYLRRYPALRAQIIQNLMVRLHSQGIVSINDLYRNALGTEALDQEVNSRIALNVDVAVRWTRKERNALQKIVMEFSAKHFSAEEITDLINLTGKHEEARELETIAGLPGISFAVLQRRLADFCQFPLTAQSLPPSDLIATRVALIRQFVSNHTEFLTIARNYIKIRDLNELAQRILGPREGHGRIGGKAASLFLAKRILEEHYFIQKKEPLIPIVVPESYYLRSDLNNEFIRINGLMAYASQKYKTPEEIEKEFPLIRELVHAGKFPPQVIAQIQKLLKHLGPEPLILRSSSLLEDNLGSTFPGKYRSIFLANQGTLKDRTERFLSAVMEIYASVFAPDPLLYRREKGLVDYNEFMGILIQKVVGKKYGDYFFPLYAGVAFSRNDYYRWDPRLRKEDGFVRMVAGMGTRAVDRVSADYPRMIALSVPSLRPQIGANEIVRKSQRHLDVINLKKNCFETLPLNEVLQFGPFPRMNLIASIVRGDEISPIMGDLWDPSRDQICLTFDKLVESTAFAAHLKDVLGVLEKAYESPVDIEFACDGEVFYLLQCRPLAYWAEQENITIPKNIPPEKILFEARQSVRNGKVPNIEYFIYVPTAEYDEVKDFNTKHKIGRIIGQLNQKFENSSFALLGPGRWGSNDINLGVRVNYADIRNTKCLIEIARKKGNYVPELSFGTHFFQDLIEAKIAYLPLYPDEPDIIFQEDFLLNSPNQLVKLLPDQKGFERYIKVIHIPTSTGGKRAHLIMDGDHEHALCYLE